MDKLIEEIKEEMTEQGINEVTVTRNQIDSLERELRRERQERLDGLEALTSQDGIDAFKQKLAAQILTQDEMQATDDDDLLPEDSKANDASYPANRQGPTGKVTSKVLEDDEPYGANFFD